jgi:3-methyladenine DNA glycosylase/8-oxoguanine DNA glycosylase
MGRDVIVRSGSIVPAIRLILLSQGAGWCVPLWMIEDTMQLNHVETRRTVSVDVDFSLAETCGPAAWVGERSPRHRWSNNTLTEVGREGDRSVWRNVRQPAAGVLDIWGTASPEEDATWVEQALGSGTTFPAFADPVIAALAAKFPGMRPMSDGSLFDGLITSIVGQSISVAAAAVTQAKLCALFGGAIKLDGRTYSPLPGAGQLADASVELIRQSGVTWKRAEAIREAAQRQARGELPDDAWARVNPERAVKLLLDLPGVGRWTAESAVLWGIGAPNAHPTNDVALLRAARRSYDRPEMTLRGLDDLAEGWRPARALAARLLWTELLGPAPTVSEAD